MRALTRARTALAARSLVLLWLAAPLGAQDEATDQEGSEPRSLVAAPFVTSSPGFGTGLGLMAMYFYRPSAADTVSPSSSLMALGAYSDTDSYLGGVLNRLHLAEDRWRVTAGLAGGRIRSDLTIGSLDDIRLDDIRLDTQVQALFVKAQRRVASSPWYAGALVAVASIDYTSRSAASDLYFKALDITDQDSWSFGGVATYDTRDEQHYPTEGVLAEAQLMLHPEWLGSTEGYHVLTLSGNR